MHKRGGTKTIHFCRSTDLSNDQWIYSRTTKGCVVVRLKGVVTRLSRSAEPSGNLLETVSPGQTH